MSRLRILPALFVTTALLTGCGFVENIPTSDPVQKSESNTSNATEQNDYYAVLGDAHREYQPTMPGQVEYCELDNLNRPACAYGEITKSLYEDEKAQERENINVDPTGWPGNNQKVTIPAINHPGSKDYNGWFWNRSHLIADSLGGAATKENLITGTRTQNVGSTQVNGQYSGGMAYTERLTREYLTSQLDDSCPVYYAAKPVYQDDELIPRSVIVDIQSCDKSLNSRVEVSNTANNYVIDYQTGSFVQKE